MMSAFGNVVRSRARVARLVTLIALMVGWSTQVAEAVPGSPDAALAAPSARTEAAAPPVLGVPDGVGYAVHDLDAVKSQLSAAVGMQFAATTTFTAKVLLPSQGKTVRLGFRRAVSVRGAPFVELVQASRPLGPWMDSSQFFISYTVDDVHASAVTLKQAGLIEVASSGRDFSFWRGIGGVLVRLIDRRVTPWSSGLPAAQPMSQATIDLGQPVVLEWVICEREAAKAQFSAALGVPWRSTLFVTWLSEYPDDGFEVATAVANVSEPGPPYLVVEKYSPERHPWDCGQPRVVYAAKDVGQAGAQLDAAGMRRAVTVHPDVAVLSEGVGGFVVEVAGETAVTAVTQMP